MQYILNEEEYKDLLRQISDLQEHINVLEGKKREDFMHGFTSTETVVTPLFRKPCMFEPFNYTLGEAYAYSK